MADYVPMSSLARNAANLLSEEGENVEYDRAIVELVSACIGGGDETKDAVRRLLHTVRHHGDMPVLQADANSDGTISVVIGRHQEVWS